MNRKTTPSPLDRRVATIWLVCMALFIGELFFYTWCRVQCTRIGYEVTGAKETYAELNTRQDNLKIELERLKSPERIARIAEEYLGLTLPKPEQMVTDQ